MLKRLFLLILAALLVCSLSSCALVGSLLGSILKLPGTILGSVTDAEAPTPAEETAEAPAEVSIVTAPLGPAAEDRGTTAPPQ